MMESETKGVKGEILLEEKVRIHKKHNLKNLFSSLSLTFFCFSSSHKLYAHPILLSRLYDFSHFHSLFLLLFLLAINDATSIITARKM